MFSCLRKCQVLLGVLLQLHMMIGTHTGYSREELLEHSPCHQYLKGAAAPPLDPVAVSRNSNGSSGSNSTTTSSDTTSGTGKQEQRNSSAEATATTMPPQQQQQQQHQSPLHHVPNSTTLPLPNENGMIVFFLHIPKTGGTTIKAPFEHNPAWRYRMVYGHQKQKQYRKEMYDTLNHWQPRNVFYEYHAGINKPYMDPQVREDLLVWKAMAQIRNIPFFAFTIVREPTSMAMSHFNFYYASRKTPDPRYYWRPNPTEADFLELSLPNPQCLFAWQSEHAYYQEYREQQLGPVNMTQAQCQQLYQTLQHDMDWIGTTETLQTDTFPLLEQISQVRYCPYRMNENWRVKWHWHNLTDAGLRHIQETTAYDRDMYERVQRDFSVSQFHNLDPPVWKINPKKKRCLYPKGEGDGLLLQHQGKQQTAQLQ